MRRQTGLTLLELLVALSIFSVMATVLFGVLALGGRSWAAVVNGSRDASEAATAQHFLRGRIEQLDAASLSGTSSTVTFRAPAPRAMATGEMLEYEITQGALDGAGSLLLRWRQPAAAAPGEGWTTEPLMADVERLAISYREGGAHPVWVNNWSGRKDLPELIRIQVERAEGRPTWPTLTVRPLVTTGVDCAFDAVLMDCRS